MKKVILAKRSDTYQVSFYLLQTVIFIIGKTFSGNKALTPMKHITD